MKAFEYQDKGGYFAIVAGSLERHAAAELGEIGATVRREVPRGVYFSCDQETLYRVLYSSRLIQRVLAPLATFACPDEQALYSQARAFIDWTSLFPVDTSFGIRANVSSDRIRHSLYAGQRLKDAICDSFRAKTGRRPDFSTKQAPVNFNLRVQSGRATISLDLTGVSMHKRGYRKSAGAAPLQETLAAALIRLSGWDGGRKLLDPMCGSGTILAEALMHYCRIPAGYLRPDSGLQFLPDHKPELLARVKAAADAAIRDLPEGLIEGSDLSAVNVQTTRDNLSLLPGGEKVKLETSRFQELGLERGRCVVTNPPYGVRLENSRGAELLYNDLGDFLKQKCPDSESYILCGDKNLVPQLRLRAHWKKNLKNADLDVVLAKIVVR
ncbi:MAG: THUMP domain-containing protein [Candidatus Cloacimonetes bacterium]|nr:THUMP domain-containing protein [Candidatus Cloacimonadota bacterium]